MLLVVNKNIMNDLLQNAQTIVIKIGSLLLRDEQENLHQSWIDVLAEDIKSLAEQGKRVVLVSSGAIAMGREALGIKLDQAPSSIPLNLKQAASAVGQFHVFSGYYRSFTALGLTPAQVLLTLSETEDRRAHLNARETLYTLMGKNIIPIINENDTVSTEEIRFGDNDRLAVRVAQMIGADLVVLLSTTDGLYTDNPQNNPQAGHIPVVDKITDDHRNMAGDAVPGLSTGGMKSKLDAADASTRAGIPLIIASGKELYPLQNLQNDGKHTVFTPQNTPKSARKRWIEGHIDTKGQVFIDEGALNALKQGKSLLPVGIKSIEGSFFRGEPVDICASDGDKIGVGLSAYDSEEITTIAGRPSSDILHLLGYARRDEVIHRDDMALQEF